MSEQAPKDPNEARDASEAPDTNEGEGNKTADRHYREGVRRHVEAGEAQAEGEEAERALEGEEGGELRRAEEEGRAGRKIPQR